MHEEVRKKNSQAKPATALQDCGPSLEYDPEYVILQARFEPVSEAQYGAFVARSEGPDWAEAERDCRRLLLRTADINLLVWLARCRTRLGGAAGLAEALVSLSERLHAHAQQIHPQHMIDGEPDPCVRANAIAALADPQGLVSDMRDIVINARAGTRLSVRDVERALAVPPPPGAMAADAVRQQLEALRASNNEVLQALQTSLNALREIDNWARQDLGEDAPDLTLPCTLLQSVVPPSQGMVARIKAVVADMLDMGAESEVRAPPEMSADDISLPAEQDHLPALRPAVQVPHVGPTKLAQARLTVPQQRDQIKAGIGQARAWFEAHEPSSPVVLLLAQAERMIGRPFAEVAQVIPLDLLEKWSAQAEEA